MKKTVMFHVLYETMPGAEAGYLLESRSSEDGKWVSWLERTFVEALEIEKLLKFNGFDADTGRSLFLARMGTCWVGNFAIESDTDDQS